MAVYNGPQSVVCETHTIPTLLFVCKSGPSSNMDTYSDVGHNLNMPRKLESLANSGLLELEPKGDGRAMKVFPTYMGSHVMEPLRYMRDAMSGL